MKKSKEEKRAQAGLERLAGAQEASSRFQTGVMQRFVGRAEPRIAELEDLFGKFLAGDRSAVTQHFGPGLNELVRGFEGAKDRITEQLPVGGEMAMQLAGVENARAQATAQPFFQASQLGLQGMGQLVDLLLGRGQGFALGGTSAAGTGGQFFGGILESEAQRRQALTNLLVGTGEAVGTFAGLKFGGG